MVDKELYVGIMTSSLTGLLFFFFNKKFTCDFYLSERENKKLIPESTCCHFTTVGNILENELKVNYFLLSHSNIDKQLGCMVIK